MKKLLFMVAVLLGLTTTVVAQDAATKKIIEMGQTDNQVMRHLDVLTNRFGGRPIGSAAYDDAAAWMVREFRKWGLDVELQEAGTLPVGFNRGPWFGRMLGGEQAMDLHFVTPSYTSGTKGVQRGHVLLEPRNRGELERMKHALKGAWVLIGGRNEGWPIDYSALGDSMLARMIVRSDTVPTGMPALFYKEMVAAGILGVIQSAPVPLRALYDPNVVRNPNLTFDTLPEVPDIKLDENQYAIIKRMVQERRTFELEFDIRNHFRLGPVKYHNVVASIKGSKYPDEYVMVTGHLDSFDVATGGIDCGTGIGPMMEAARMIAASGAKPKRTILFVAFAGEEFGLLGATAFAKQHTGKLDRISNLFNRDGGPLPPVGISVPQAMLKDFEKICEPIKTIRPDYPFEVKVSGPRTQPTRPGGTDASVFSIKGVPTINFIEADFKGYNFSYGEIWHTERDLYTKNIPEYQEQAATVIAVVALGVANLDKQLSREGLYKEPER